ncbi:CmpA/NrtA family ABC transporter substrate-binding protein [Nesterenkonia sphaerica]|uniref:ABC transporter substrate-binding protein n=1 Tax=Nesterenkonia sphaerica TaxID=1804988 RepID=A0A5R9AEP5_9MICC|nr:CmpA/NrtA family ABC transporter substrate-binding protein [Nesterenkonia sphaerica]TLP77093.1 ABC transporter substrate-binding protein [Nesterenkonia sphaerica]
MRRIHPPRTDVPPHAAPSLSRRRLFSLGAGISAATMLSACTSGAPTGSGTASAGLRPIPAAEADLEQREITIGFFPITCSSPIVNAAAMSIFEQYGLDVTLRRYTGWAELWIAFVAGEVDATQFLAPMPLAIHHGFASGQRALRLPYVTNTNGNGITVSQRLAGQMSGPGDFRGLRLGLPFDYSVHNLLARDYLVSGGLDPEEDVDLRIMRPADMVTALAVGEIDAFCLPDQFNQRAVAEGVGFIHVLTKDLWADHPCCSFAVAEDFAAQNPNVYMALLRAIGESALYVDDPEHRADTAALMSQPAYLGLPEPVLNSVLTGDFPDGTGNEHSIPDRIGFQPYPHESYGIWILNALQRWGLTGDHSFTTGAEYSRAVSEVFDSQSAGSVLSDFGGVTDERTEETVLGAPFNPQRPAEWSERL